MAGECHTPQLVLISLLLKQRHWASGVTQGPALRMEQARKECLLSECSRRCLHFNWESCLSFSQKILF